MITTLPTDELTVGLAVKFRQPSNSKERHGHITHIGKHNDVFVQLHDATRKERVIKREAIQLCDERDCCRVKK